MRVILAGGGTAGHINPALAIASYLKEHEPGVKILYIGAKGGMEENLVPEAGLPFKGIEISGFSRQLNINAFKRNIITLKRIVTSSIESKKLISEFRPDICIGTGGYVSGPVLKKANNMGIPTVIHEQNAFPGMTTRMLSKKAKWIMLAVPEAQKYLNSRCNVVITGNPIRKEIITASKENSKTTLNLDARPVILSFGGSLGARKINETVAGLIAHTTKTDCYQHIHAYGKYGGWFPGFLKEKGVDLQKHPNLSIQEYIKNMPACLAAADLAICRAGAITLSELQAQGKPAILIPSPNVAKNHQYHNAMVLVRNKAAQIVEEKDLTDTKLIKIVKEMLDDKLSLAQYAKNSKKMAILNANARIYEIIKKVIP
ncbi:MAG: undecaprenyldiphospho-muramoylpentapeptide beta-N-acetylglucosaminyltransferase [Oscillospiraceae bacterium]|nr:undecaprenyldiphospho-muramoylpentapeptide beta-N-acetylglucosaminyltransferase [Oscillospiraceae bacterium]